MKKIIPISALLLIFCCYVMQMFFGVNVSMRGFLLPQVTDYFRINYTSGGLIFLLPSIPLIIGSLLTGFIFSHYNKKLIALSGAFLMCISLILLTFSPNFSTYLFFTTTMSFGTMIIFNVTNITTAEFFSAYKPKYRSNGLLLLHFFFGFGSISAMTAANLFLGENPSWQMVFRIMGILLAIIISGFVFSEFIVTEKPPVSPSLRELGGVIGKPRMLLYGIAAAFYVGSEFAIINWCPMFLEKGLSLSKSYSATVMMLFFVCFTGGRLLASFLIHKVDQTKAFIFLCIGGIASAIFAFIFQLRLFGFDIFIPVAGLFFAAIFPILQNHVIRDFEKQLSMSTGVLYASANIGGSLMPFSIGVLNDIFGVRAGITVTGIFLLICMSAFIAAQRIQPNDASS